MNLVCFVLKHNGMTHLKNELTSCKTKSFSSESNLLFRRARRFSTMHTKARQQTVYPNHTQLPAGQDSVLGIAARYGLDRLGFESR
jgi:hypothetical protein